MNAIDVLIVGARGGTNIGQSLFEGAQATGLKVELVDTQKAMAGPEILKKIFWHFFERRPLRLGSFSDEVVDACARLHPRSLVAVGIAPIHAQALRRVRAMGVKTFNFPTDDPWSASHRSRWALRALREYDVIASPRRANMGDFARLGCGTVAFVPFGYDPRHFFPSPAEESLAADVIFVGGADADRVSYIAALRHAGFRIALYGSYWERFTATQGLSRGQAGPDVIRRATASAKVALCLVRRANRDGHVMRSLEIAAIGACMVVEDTEEHRELFGPEGETVSYFRTEHEMTQKIRAMLADDAARERMAKAVQRRILDGANTYADRLRAILSISTPGSP